VSAEFRYDGVLLDPERVRLPPNPGGVSGLPEAAFNGEVGTAGITIEDPDGDLDLVGLHEFTVDEPDCVGAERIFTGFLYGRTITRGNYRTGPGRVWVCDIVDQNFAWGLKVFRASSAKRPAESDNTRMRFMLESAPMAATPVFDNGLFNTTDNPINFGDSDYVGQYPVELAVSVAGTSGKNFYAYWDDTANEISGYYDLVSAVNRTATIAVSNVIADNDSTTFYPTIDAEMRRNPENVNSGILLGYRGGYVYLQRAETITDFIDRDMVHRTDRIGREATANAVAASMLLAMSVEQDTISCTIRVPSSQVNHARAGMWMDVRFTHLPGLEATTSLPIIRRNVTPVAGRKDRYDIQLELSNKAPERGPGGGDPGEFPPATCDPTTGSLVQMGTLAVGDGDGVFPTLSSTPTPGNTLVARLSFQDSATDATYVPPDWTAATPMAHDNDTDFSSTTGRGIRLFYKLVESGDGTSYTFDADTGSNRYVTAQIAEFQGGLDYVTGDSDEDAADTNAPTIISVETGSVTPTAAKPTLIIAAGIAGDQQSGIVSAWAPTWNVGTKLDDDTGGADRNVTSWAYLQDGSPDATPVSMSFTNAHSNGIVHGTGGVVAIFECTGGSSTEPPAAGQWVYDQPVTPATDGVETTFTAPFPFADGSFIVKVDDLDQTAAVTSYDGEAGTFTLSFAPTVTELVTITFQGR
jgi:hypothetical protein